MAAMGGEKEKRTRGLCFFFASDAVVSCSTRARRDRGGWLGAGGGGAGHGAFFRGGQRCAQRRAEQGPGDGGERGPRVSLSLLLGSQHDAHRGHARRSGDVAGVRFLGGDARGVRRKKTHSPRSGPRTWCPPPSPLLPMTQPAPALFRLAGSVLRRLGGAVDAVGAGLQGRFASPEKGEAAFCAGSSAGSRAGGRRRLARAG